MGICEFPCLDNFENWMRKGKIVLTKRLKIALIWTSQKILLILKFTPDFLNRYLARFFSSTGHIGVSNVPGLRKEITFGGYALKDCHFITPNGLWVGTSILGCTYNGKFRYCVYQDTAIEAKANKIVEHIEKVIQEEIDKIDDSH